MQERLGEQIADTLVDLIDPHGVAVHLEAAHLCTQMRGVREENSRTVTTFWRGSYAEDPELRRDFLQVLQGRCHPVRPLEAPLRRGRLRSESTFLRSYASSTAATSHSTLGCLYANFVSTLDGVVAIAGAAFEPPDQRASEADRFVMGLLRACADAVLIGAGSPDGSPKTLWTAERAFPAAALGVRGASDATRLAPAPERVVLSASGSIDLAHPALESGALVITTNHGAAMLGRRLPSASRVLSRWETVPRSTRPG